MVLSKKINEILIGQTPVERNAIYYFYHNLFLLVVWTCWKRNTCQILMKFHFIKRKIYFETLFYPSFYVLRISPIVYMDNTELIFHDLFLYCTTSINCTPHCNTMYTTLQYNVHYTAIHCTLHYDTVYTTLQYTVHYTTIQCTLHCNILYTTLYNTVHYTVDVS